MPLVPNKLKKDLEDILIAAFNREFAEEIAVNPKAKENHQKMAKAISDIALVIVKTLTTEAMITAGIPTAGSPASQVTVGLGKIT